MSEIKRVKLSIALDNCGVGRQLPGRSIEYNGYHFHINEDIPEANYWVVYSKGRRVKETCRCASQNTIFVTGEPETVYHYSPGFIKQFARVLSVQPKINHANMRLVQPAQPWHIGKISPRNTEGKETGSGVTYSKDYDSLIVSNPIKSKKLSIITSNKCFTKGHKDRVAFALALKNHYGEEIDLFGHGFNDFEDKWDVIAPYEYHVCIENSSFPHYWTEKLADSFLGNAYPLYYGAPNIYEYFSEKALTLIDIHDIEKSIRIIDEVLKNDLAKQNKEDVQFAKMQVLDKYNLFNLLIEEFERMNADASKTELTIKPDTAFADIKKFKIMLFDRIKNKFF